MGAGCAVSHRGAPTNPDAFSGLPGTLVTMTTQVSPTRRAWMAFALGGLAAAAHAQSPAVPARVLDAAAFGARGDGRTDDTAALQAWATALSEMPEPRARLQPGVYLCGAELVIRGSGLQSFQLDAPGAEIVVTAPAAQNKRYLRVANITQSGGVCRISGLSMRHDRPTERSSGTDMVSVAGFADYVLEDITVSSADNMGITVGRGDPKGYAPRSCVIRRPVVGGRQESEPHSHASIGDTGIWVVNAPQRTEILDAKVRSTGDDGILVGHSHSPLAGNCQILNADVRDTGANGILVAVPHGRITGRVDRTNGSGVALIRLDGAQGSQMRVEVDIRRPGRLLAGDIGRDMIPKRNPWGIWVWQGGPDAGQLDLDGCAVSDTFASAIVLQPYKDGALAGIRGRVRCQDVGTATQAARAKSAVLRRPPTPGAVSDVQLVLDVRRSAVPLVSWALTADQADQGIDVQIKASQCTVDPAFVGRPLLEFPGASSQPRLTDSQFRVVTDRCDYGDAIRPQVASWAAGSRFSVR